MELCVEEARRILAEAFGQDVARALAETQLLRDDLLVLTRLSGNRAHIARAATVLAGIQPSVKLPDVRDAMRQPQVLAALHGGLSRGR